MQIYYTDITVDGGRGGDGATIYQYSSEAGADGDNGTVLVSSIFDIINS